MLCKYKIFLSVKCKVPLFLPLTAQDFEIYSRKNERKE